MNYANKVIYIDDNSIMVITKDGTMRQLYVPYVVKCLKATGSIKELSKVYVTSVMEHDKYLIIYKIYDKWYPYSYFRIVFTS